MSVTNKKYKITFNPEIKEKTRKFRIKLITDIEYFINKNLGISEAMEWKDMTPLQREISDGVFELYEKINHIFKKV